MDGATIHFKTAGRGDRFQVVICDRRRLPRSGLDDPQQEMTIERHADDAHAVLGAVTDGPALVFGGSLGAVVALDLAVRRPESVGATIAFEPPLPGLMPDAQRGAAHAACDQSDRAS